MADESRAKNRNHRSATGRKEASASLRPGESIRAAALRRMAPWLLTGLAALYLVRFMTTGGLRQVIYERLLTIYLLLPDRLVADLTDLWTDGRWESAAVSDRFPVMIGAAALLLACWSCGRLILGSRIPTQLTAWETVIFSLAIGLNVWSTVVLALGLTIGFAWPWLLRLPMLAVTLAGIWYQWRQWSVGGTGSAKDTGNGAEPWQAKWLGVILVPMVLLYLLTAALPPWEFDVREYHLQVPKEWYQAGRVTFLPHNVYGNMPLGAVMPTLVAMQWISGPLAWWWGALVGKLVLSGMALATGLAIYSFGRRFFYPLAGLMGAIVYVSTPWVFHVSTVGLVEGAVGFYLFLALYALLLADSTNYHGRDAEGSPAFDPSADSDSGEVRHEQSSIRLGMYALAGYMAGAAVACKYTGLVFVVFPLLLLVVWQVRFLAWRRIALVLTLFLALVTAGCGLWFAKNLVFTGNPTYPLLYGVFGGEPWNEEKNERWREAHGPPRSPSGYRFSLGQLRMALVDLGWYSDKLNPLTIPLLLFCLLERRRRGLQVQLAALLVVNFVIWWLLTHRYDRFFVPMFPVLSMLAGVGGAWIGQRRAYPLLVLFLIAGVSVNTLVVSSGILTGDNRIFVPLEVMRRDSWHFVRVHPAHRFLNHHVPPGKSALVVGEAQVFDLEVPVYYSTCWDDSFLELWMEGKTREQRLERLRQHGISHVFVHWHEIDRYRSPGNYGFTDFVTKDFVRNELVDQQKILRPVPVPTDDGVLDPEHGEVFEVVGD